MLRGIKQPPKTSQEERQANEDERTHHGIPSREWDAAFAWVDGEYTEVTPPAGAAAAGPAEGGSDLAYQVWPCNWETVMVFHACDTRWHINAGGAFELDYAGVDVVLKHMKLADPSRTFAEIQAMEARALEVLHG